MDEIEKSLQDQKRRLLSDIMSHEQNFYIQNMSIEVQEKMVKEGILIKLKKMITDLNDACQDVRFSYEWGLGSYGFNQEMNKVVSGYNKIDPRYGDQDDDHDDDYFLHTDLNEAVVKIKYLWLQTCNLGCVHRTERFYIMNIPKLLDMLAYHSLGATAQTLIKEFVPDFFYDLKPKKTRSQLLKDYHAATPPKPPVDELPELVQMMMQPEPPKHKRGRPKLSANSKPL